MAVIGVSVLGLEGASRLGDGGFYLAAVQHLAQETTMPAETVSAPVITTSPDVQPMPQQPAEQKPKPEEGNMIQPLPGEGFEEREEFVDPREIQDGLRNINQFRSEARRTLKQIKKQATAADINEINQIIATVDQIYSTVSRSSASDARNALRDFYDEQYFDQINRIRTRLEIPKEIKQIKQSLKRVERIAKTKAVQNIGIDIPKLQQRIGEMNQAVATVESHYASGNYEEAQEAMQEFHEGGHPGEVEGTINRIRDIKNMVKRVKDETIRTEVDGVLQEVIDAFNAGEYRDARETLDEYADDIQRLISQFLLKTNRRGYKQDSLNRINSLEDLIKARLERNSEAVQFPQEGTPTIQVTPVPVQ